MGQQVMAAITISSHDITWLEEDVCSLWVMRDGIRNVSDIANMIESSKAHVLLKGFDNLSNPLMSYHPCHCGDKS